MTLSTPSKVEARLEEIEHDLELRQNLYESAARNWYLAKRDKEHARAIAFLSAEGSVAVRSAEAERLTALSGKQEEAEFEALKAVMRTLETRASVLQSLLRSQGRV